MEWIVIEMMDPENPQILLEDEMPFIGTREEAVNYAGIAGQAPIIVPLSSTLTQDLFTAFDYISMAKFELEDEDDGGAEESLGKYLFEDE